MLIDLNMNPSRQVRFIVAQGRSFLKPRGSRKSGTSQIVSLRWQVRFLRLRRLRSEKILLLATKRYNAPIESQEGGTNAKCAVSVDYWPSHAL
jgi:hypothetical protein